MITTQALPIHQRPRRNRKSPALRRLIRENTLSVNDLVQPIFLIDGSCQEELITSMPGITRKSLDVTLKQVKQLYQLGIPAIDLFAMTPKNLRTLNGAEASKPGNLISKAISAIKEAVPEMCVMVDIALDPYTTTGHDGICDPDTGYVINDVTVEALIEMSLLAARSGADVIAPSDMMDGRVKAIRNALDQEGYTEVSILAYTAKYASSFYGPFRDALDSSPQFGDKSTYQMDPANRREALLEAMLDEKEGADMLMVKPGLPYLDVISDLRKATALPIAAYQVSGEYAMIKAADEKGWIDGERVMLESLQAFKRAGADFILSYGAEWFAANCQ